MVEPYRMVIVNAILLTCLTCSVIAFKTIFSKRKISYLIVLLLYALLPLVSILRKGTYESGALSEYVLLSYNFYQNLLTGVLFPQWAPYLCAHYGCPDFIFMYPLPYYIVSLFHVVGFSFISSIKLLLVTTYLSSGIAMYFLAKQFMKEKYAFSAGILYLFAPYHLVNLHFQIDIAEMTSFALVPLCFLAAYKLVIKANTITVTALTCCTALLILSHPVISISSIPFIFLFGLLIWKDTKRMPTTLLLYFLSFFSAFLLTAYYWLPAIAQSKYIYWGLHAVTTPLPITSMLFAPWRFGFLFQGPIGQLSYFLGFAHWVIIISVGIYLFRIRKKFGSNFLLAYCFIAFLTIFIGIQEISAAIWTLPILKSFQMTSRLLVLIAFFTSFMGGLWLSTIHNKSVWLIICVIAISTTILNWGNRRPIPQIDDAYLIYELMHKPPMSMDLTTPKWTNFNKTYFQEIPKEPIEILSGKGKMKILRHDPTVHEYIVDADTNLVVKENTFYFPSWNLYIDEKKSNINYTSPDYKGLMIFTLNKGLHYIELRFEHAQFNELFDTLLQPTNNTKH